MSDLFNNACQNFVAQQGFQAAQKAPPTNIATAPPSEKASEPPAKAVSTSTKLIVVKSESFAARRQHNARAGMSECAVHVQAHETSNLR
jgi:hypothetical protein